MWPSYEKHSKWSGREVQYTSYNRKHKNTIEKAYSMRYAY